jgi:hypothetical protein
MGIALAALVVACLIGWHASRVHMSHRGIPVRKGQLRSFRSDRLRHAIWFVVTAIVLLVILFLVAVR